MKFINTTTEVGKIESCAAMIKKAVYDSIGV